MAQRLETRGAHVGWKRWDDWTRKVEEFTFSAQSVGRLASTLTLPIRNHALPLPDDPDLIDELANLRLRETSPGVLRIDHDPDKHDDRAIALALAAHRLAQDTWPQPKAAKDEPPMGMRERAIWELLKPGISPAVSSRASITSTETAQLPAWTLQGNKRQLSRHARGHTKCTRRRPTPTRPLADLLGQADEESFGPADVAEPIHVLVLNHVADELRAALTEPGERIVDVLHGEHDA